VLIDKKVVFVVSDSTMIMRVSLMIVLYLLVIVRVVVSLLEWLELVMDLGGGVIDVVCVISIF